MDYTSLTAIDVHVHVLASKDGRLPAPDSYAASAAKMFGVDKAAWQSVPQLADMYRKANMACVVFMVDRAGLDPVVTNEEIADLAARENGTVIPFGSVDPARRERGAHTLRRLIEHYGIRGVKFHPGEQGFFPNDQVAYPLYEILAEHGLPALFHTGQTAVGAGMPGGGGIRLKYSNPLYLDDVAADFPQMPIIMAHPSVPWQDEAISIALHKENVYIDLSGYAPKYIPERLLQHANTLLKRKVLFGSDYPAFTPENWISQYDALGLREEVRPLILKDNAIKLLGLGEPAT